MAKAKKVGRDGIDSWTNNGHGLINIKQPKKSVTKTTSKGKKK